MGLAERRRLFAATIELNARQRGLARLAPDVVAAMAAVPRHRLLERFWTMTPVTPPAPPDLLEHTVDPDDPSESALETIYADQALITRHDAGGVPTSSTSQPSLVAAMLQTLELGPGTRVLEVGAGTGYNAALLSELVGDQRLVTTIDIDPDVVAQTRRLLAAAGYSEIAVLCGDGFDGAPERGPFDRLIATVGCPDVSWRWLEQLARDAFVVLPLQHGGPTIAPIAVLRPAGDDELVGHIAMAAGFIPLQGDRRTSPWPPASDHRRGEPDEVFDLPAALAEHPRTLASYRAGHRAWLDFGFFLAIADTRTRLGQHVTLEGPAGASLVLTDREVAGYGDCAGLAADLAASYDRWEQLDRPATTDWQLMLRRRTREQPIVEPGDDRWLLARPWSWQMTSLAAP